MFEDYQVSFNIGKFFKDHTQGSFEEISDFLKSRGLADHESEFKEKLDLHVELKNLAYDEKENIYRKLR